MEHSTGMERWRVTGEGRTGVVRENDAVPSGMLDRLASTDDRSALGM